MLAEHIIDHVASARGPDAVQNRGVADQHPFPGHAGAESIGGQPSTGFIARDNRRLAQPRLDHGTRALKRAVGSAQRIGDGPFANPQAEHSFISPDNRS